MPEREQVTTAAPAPPAVTPAAPVAAPATALTAAAVLSLQRTAGNAATTRWLQRVKADGSIDDAAEMDKSRPIDGAVDADTRKKVMDTLEATPRTKTLLDDIKKLRGDLNFDMKWSNRGTYHGSGAVWLDRNMNYETWRAGLAHELVHLHTFLSGAAADITKMSRADFVKAKMDDEINAHATSYVALLQQDKKTAPAMGFAEFRASLEKDHAKTLTDKDWPEVERLAKAWLEDKYKNDANWTTSNTHENYYDYWGKAWDKAHPAATP
jgi:hypothetical protein